MSFSLTRSHETDSYNVMSSYNTSPDDQEVAIVDALVKGTIETITNNIYTSPANNSEWCQSKLDDNFVDTSVISNYQAGIVTKNSVISVEYAAPESLETYSANIGNADDENEYSFSMLDTTASLYDSNYLVTQSYLSNFYDNDISIDGSVPDGAKYGVSFDTLNTNYVGQYAVNSEWNSKLGPYDGLNTTGTRPVAVSEASDLNTQSLGKQGDGDQYVSKYATSSIVDGSISFSDISDDYQPVLNNLDVIPRTDFTNFSVENDVGIFRWQQNLENPAKTFIQLESQDPELADDYLTQIPLMDANADGGLLNPNSDKNNLSVPGTMSSDEFYSLFNTAVLGTVSEGYTFRVDANTSNGGYFIDNTNLTSNMLLTDLNNDNLLDNPYYMENYVSDEHTIEFSDSTIQIVETSNANELNNNLITIDLTAGETLTSLEAGQNGEIKINTNTPNTRITEFEQSGMTGTSESGVYVYYSGSDVISEDMMTNPYLAVEVSKLVSRSSAQETINPDNVLSTSNDAFLTHYTNQITNADSDGENLNFNNLFEDDNIRLWRLDVQNTLGVEPNSFYAGYDDENNMCMNLVDGISVEAIIQHLSENLTSYESYREKLTAKSIDSTGLSAAVQAAGAESGWTIRYTNDDESYLKSSSTIAFNDTNSLPNYNVDLINTINNGAPLYFSYEYKTNDNSSTHGGLQDYVKVSYSLNPDLVTDATIFNIPQTSLTRTYYGIPVPTISDVNFAYSILTGPYSMEQWKLVSVSKESTFDVTFIPNYGPFTNITLGINSIQQVDVFYSLQNRSTGKIAPQSALNYVSCAFNVKTTTETVTPILSTISGILNANDLKPFTGIVEGRLHSDNNWYTVSDAIDFESYYCLDNIHVLTITDTVAGPNNPNGPDITIRCEYSPFNTLSQSVDLTDENYFIPYTYNVSDNYYSVTSFTCSPSDLPVKTTLVSDPSQFLTVENNYQCIIESNWVSTDYTVTADLDENGVTTFSVLDIDSNIVFEINTNSNVIFLGTRIVSYIPYDIWSSTKYLGQSSDNNTSDTVYESTSYPNDTMSFSNIPGIFVSLDSLDYDVGCNMFFRVLGDFAIINPVGTLSNDEPTSENELGSTLYNDGSLVFQYGANEPNYSAIFTFNRYRGYYENSTQDSQLYTIARDSLSVTFKVGSDLSQVVSSNTYINEELTVDNLINDASETCANLNIKFSTLYSMPPTGSDLIYPINVFGDSVTITVDNAQYIGGQTNIPVPDDSTPVVNPINYYLESDLKTYGRDNLYTFSGIYISTSQLVAFRPSRVKITNESFTYSSFSYYIHYQTPPAFIYKAIPQTEYGVNYLGNPELIDESDPTIDIDTTKWQLMYTLETYNDKLTGVNVGSKTIKQSSIKNLSQAVSYFISVPPYYNYEIVSTENNLQTPYDYDSLSDNKVNTYIVYDESTSSFNPFSPVIYIDDVMGNELNIYHDELYLNNITFTHLQPKTILDLSNSSDSQRYGISVPGVKLTITLYNGLYDSIYQPHLIYDGLITSISSTPDISLRSIILKDRADDGSVNFSVLQKPEDIGYPSGLLGYKKIFKTDEQTYYYNIDFNIGNIAWFNDNLPETYFDAQAEGISPTLYTVVDLNDTITKVNFRRVYKYEPTTSIKINDGDIFQTLSLTFNSGRSFYDTPVIQPDFNSDPTYKWSYPEMVKNTNIDTSNPITWTFDETFSDTVYVNWSFGNTNTGKNMPVELFYVENEARKWSYITLLPFQSLINQFGLVVNEITWDGSIYTPLLSVSNLKLQPSLESPNLDGNTYEMEQYSVSSLNN